MLTKNALKLPFSAYVGDDPSIFVSYAHRDQEEVYRDLAHYHASGMNLWYDEGIRIGAPWREEVADAISRASMFLFYVSESSLASVACIQEINYALDCNKPILTVFLTNQPLTPGLRLSLGGVQGIERFRLDYQDFCAKTVSGIKSLLASGPIVVNPDVATQIVQSSSLAEHKVSLAVMPFESLSTNPDNALLADGLTEDITNTLSRMPDTIVISRNTCRAFRDRGADARQAGQELGVNYVVEGQVRAAGSRLRVAASLVDCRTGAKLWSDRLDRELADLFDLQDELTTALCAQLQPNLVLAEAERVRSDNISAWAHFHKGWAIWNFEYTGEASTKAVAAFEEALRIDPDYGPAHAALAIVLVNRATWGWSVDTQAEVTRAFAAADTAMALAPEHALTHYAAAVRCNAFGDRRESVTHAERALELEPCNASLISMCGLMCSGCGQVKRGIEMANYALRLSPRDPRLHMLFNNLWMVQWGAQDYDGIVAACQQSLRVRREANPWAVVGLIVVNVARGEFAMALENHKRLGGFSLTNFMRVALRENPYFSPEQNAESVRQHALFKELGMIE